MTYSQNSDNENIQATRPYRRLGYQIANVQGVGCRARQEDSFTLANAFDVKAVAREGLLFVVCDGMGGMADGKLASETAIASIRESFASMDRQGDISYQINQALYLACERVYGRLRGDGGSTAIFAIIYDEKLYFASVGDSYFYLKRGNSLIRLNREHNVCNQIYLDCIRSNSMDPTEGRNSVEAVALTQYIGMDELTDIDYLVKPMPLKEGDVLLSCSDGVGGTLSEDEVFASLSIENPQVMCEAIERGIVQHAKPNQDNYTGIIVKCVR